MTRTTSPSMKTEKNPIPNLPMGSKPLARSPGCSDVTNSEFQYDEPKSRNGPDNRASDMPTPLSSTRSHQPSDCVTEIRTSPQFDGRASETLRAWTASTAF